MNQAMTVDQVIDNIGYTMRLCVLNPEGFLPEIDLVAVICRRCGWHELLDGQECTVHFGSRRYTITRDDNG